MFDLTGRVALVTGSTRGIGHAIAEALARAGASVVLHGREPQAAQAAAEALSQETVRTVRSVAADLAVPETAAGLVAAASGCFGKPPDIVVLNASVEARQTLAAITAEAIAWQTQVNLTATIQLLQRLVPGMVERGWGRVLAIGSVQEHRPNAHQLFYAATKLAQTGMVLSLARTIRAEGGQVTFNVLKPGAIATDRNREALEDEAYRRQVLDRIPLGRIGASADCAAAALLLCSEQGGYINGAELDVDGGLRL